MFTWLRSLFAPEVRELQSRLGHLETRWAEVETDVTSLTDKLSSQLKRMRQRHVGAEPELSREEALNQAIRARRRSRFTPSDGDE